MTLTADTICSFFTFKLSSAEVKESDIEWQDTTEVFLDLVSTFQIITKFVSFPFSYFSPVLLARYHGV